MTTNGTAKGFTPQELGGFRILLLERRHQLLGDLRALETAEAVPEVFEGASHLADFSTEREAADFSLGRRESESTEVQEIDDALERLRDGSFGFCETCGDRILKARLGAIPYARLCLPCKSAEEG